MQHRAALAALVALAALALLSRPAHGFPLEAKEQENFLSEIMELAKESPFIEIGQESVTDRWNRRPPLQSASARKRILMKVLPKEKTNSPYDTVVEYEFDLLRDEEWM